MDANGLPRATVVSMSSAPRAIEMSIDQSSAFASLAVPGSKASGEISSGSLCR
jgi:hypothetical protein